ncbi:MAG TPA: hypothetical protein V6C72_08810, partial [Chroococcales cyanobacterium]
MRIIPKKSAVIVRLKHVIAVLVCLTTLLPRGVASPAQSFLGKPNPDLAADTLGVRAKVERLQLLVRAPDEHAEEILLLRAALLRKLLRGVLVVRQYCNRLDMELAYTYDIMQKETRRQTYVGQLFTLANFAQLSTFYTLEPFVRLQNEFRTSAIFTTVSGSLNTTISTLSRGYVALAKARNVAPPAVLDNLVEGGPVDGSGMPPLLSTYFSTKSGETEKSRKEQLYSFWLRQYDIDASNNENLCALADKKSASLNLVRSRILLLWSLRTAVLQFDRDLLALLKIVDRDCCIKPPDDAVGTADGPNEVVRLLGLMPYINELKELRRSGSESMRTSQLELCLLERTLEGALEIQAAADKVDEELYYNYHIVLSDLLNSRSKWLQRTYDANFLQSGILGIVAGRLYLTHHSYAGDQMFVISGSNGTALTLLAAAEMHGSWRKVDTGPNSLANV